MRGGRKPVLSDARLRYLLRAERIRARLSRKVLAKKWGVSLSVLSHAIAGITTTVEQWEARYPPSMTPPAIKARNFRRRPGFKHTF